MDTFSIDADIFEKASGRSHHVKLACVLRVGDLIELSAYADHGQNQPVPGQFKVVQISHRIVGAKKRMPETGAHSLDIVVEPTKFSHGSP